MVLNGINIRSGLELEVPVLDIFNVNVAPDGNMLAKQFCMTEGSERRKLMGEIRESVAKEQIITYTDLKIPQRINDTLTCYVFDSYFVFEDEFGSGRIESEKNVELLFVNSEIMNLDGFCSNIMAAQAFTGNFEEPQFNHHFIGVGEFEFDEYVPLHNMVAHTNLNLINFFVFHRKVLSSIGYFICGLYENDVKDQKKYLTDQEYKNLMSFAKRQKRNVMNAFKKATDSEFDGLF
jgi:hypothetical protein